MDINHNRYSPLVLTTRVIACLLAVVIALGIGSVASAGGWAISTLDELPNPIAGEPIQVGFTILAHGISPIDISEGVGVNITFTDGTTDYFPAAGDGTPGHYVARVEFPSVGRYSWSIRQGRLGDHDLGQIEVSAATSIKNTNGSLVSLRYAALGGAMLFGLVALTDLFVSRRRRLSLS